AARDEPSSRTASGARRATVPDVNRRAGRGSRDRAGREYLLQWTKELETALAEAFDHADVSLIDLLDSDGDAAPIGADVEEIERLPKVPKPIVIVKANVGGSAPQALPVAGESPEDPVQVGLAFQQVDVA